MDKEQALYQFWAGFGWPAYDENSVPDDAKLPYITYEDAVSDFDNAIPLSASLWHRSDSWKTITAKAKEIVNVIGRGGVKIGYDGGGFWLTLSSPQYQRMPESSDNDIRRILFNVMIEYID